MKNPGTYNIFLRIITMVSLFKHIKVICTDLTPAALIGLFLVQIAAIYFILRYSPNIEH